MFWLRRDSETSCSDGEKASIQPILKGIRWNPKCAWNKHEEVVVQKQIWQLSLMSHWAFSTSLSAHIGFSYGLHPGIEMDSHRKNWEEMWSWAWRLVEGMSKYLFRSFFCLPSLHPVLVEDPHLSSAGSSSHEDSSAFQGLWQSLRRS